jgi:hypothetical protein
MDELRQIVDEDLKEDDEMTRSLVIFLDVLIILASLSVISIAILWLLRRYGKL